MDTPVTADPLTDLADTRTIMAQLAQAGTSAESEARALSVILLDVDRLKEYTDRRGHIAGDETLLRIAGVLAANVRSGGRSDRLGRVGGDEFLVILPHTDVAEALAAAERLRACVEAADWPDQAMTVSVGVATWSPGREWHTDGAAALLREAERAMFQAKTLRNAVRHASEIGPDTPKQASE
jgi:diguanylate cyclase (GGDEF)-like protein